MIQRKTLPNGVEVIASTNPDLHSFCATVRICTGAGSEKITENGISHLLEHCVVRGLRGHFQEDLYGLLSRNGLYFNARTGNPYIEFDICGSPAGIPLAADMLRQMLTPIRLSAKDYRIEKDRILAEMIFRQTGGPHADFERRYWEGSPVGRPILGTPAKVNRISRNRLNGYLQSLLVPGNVQLCLTGGISEEHLALLLDAAAQIPMHEGQHQPRELQPPRDFGKREKFVHYPADVDYLRFDFDIDPAKCPKAVMDLIREILFCGSDALFYRQLSEDTGLIYGYAFPFVEYRNFGTTGFGFHVDMNRMEPTMQALQRAMQMLEKGEYDLESKKRMLLTAWAAIQDESVTLNGRLLHYMMLTDSPEPPDWDAVTREQITACAEAAFDSGLAAILHRGDWAEVEKIMNRALGWDGQTG